MSFELSMNTQFCWFTKQGLRVVNACHILVNNNFMCTGTKKMSGTSGKHMLCFLHIGTYFKWRR